MFVTFEDFNNFRYIPNLGSEPTVDIIDGYIDEFEFKYYREVFGYTNGKLIMDNPIDAKYEIIINGGEYIDANGDTQYFVGTKEASADYIYFQYIQGTAVGLTSAGYIQGTAENSIQVQPVTKPNLVWNNMIDKMIDLPKLILSDPTNYPDWIINNYESLNDFGL